MANIVVFGGGLQAISVCRSLKEHHNVVLAAKHDKIARRSNYIDEYIELDSELMSAFKDTELKNNLVSGEGFPELIEGDKLPLIFKEVEQKFTQPPAHYSEAKIVKLMEEVGIGRPSTYASTIKTLKQRGYTNNQSGLISMKKS